MKTAPRRVEARRVLANEAALIAGIVAGDLTGLGALFDLHGDDVRRFFSRLGVPTSDIDDLIQETFLDVVRAAPRFHAEASVRPWLLGIAMMHARRRRRSVARIMDRLRQWATESVEAAPPTPEENFESRALAARATRALDSLSARKREAFVLVALEGLSGEAAALALGIPVATLWTRLHHARNDLFAALEDHE